MSILTQLSVLLLLCYWFRTNTNRMRHLSVLPTAIAKRISVTASWFTVKRGTSLLAASVLLINLLAWVATQQTIVHAQSTSPKTIVLYVNGVSTSSDDVRTKDLPGLQRAWNTYAASKGIVSPVAFDFSYNTHQTFTRDMLQGTAQLLNVSLDTLLHDTRYNPVAMYAYIQEALKSRLKR